jgi:hypothetical protein
MQLMDCALRKPLFVARQREGYANRSADPPVWNPTLLTALFFSYQESSKAEIDGEFVRYVWKLAEKVTRDKAEPERKKTEHGHSAVFSTSRLFQPVGLCTSLEPWSPPLLSAHFYTALRIFHTIFR